MLALLLLAVLAARTGCAARRRRPQPLLPQQPRPVIVLAPHPSSPPAVVVVQPDDQLCVGVQARGKQAPGSADLERGQGGARAQATEGAVRSQRELQGGSDQAWPMQPYRHAALYSVF